MARLAPRDGKRLAAVTRPEDVADRDFRRRVCLPALLSPAQDLSDRGDVPGRPAELPGRPPSDRAGDVAMLRRREEPAMGLEEAKHASLLLRRRELAGEAHLPWRWRASRAGRPCRLVGLGALPLLRRRMPRRRRPRRRPGSRQRPSTDKRAELSGSTSPDRTERSGARRKAGPLLSRDRKTVPETRTSNAQFSLRSSKKSVTSVRAADNSRRLPRREKWLRGRDSNPNFLVQSQASCR